jgi:hypothetical protein
MPKIVLGLSKPLADANAQIAMELPFHHDYTCFAISSVISLSSESKPYFLNFLAKSLEETTNQSPQNVLPFVSGRQKKEYTILANENPKNTNASLPRMSP